MHNQNARGRILYTVALFLIYDRIIKGMKLSVNTSIYGLFAILILSYYIFGVYNLREKYKTKELLVTSTLNGLVFFILLIFHKKIEIIYYFIFYTLAQNLCRCVLGKIYKKNLRVIILGQEPSERKIKDLILRDPDYSYLGFVGEKDINSLGEPKDLDSIIKKYSCNEVIYIRNTKRNT